MSYLITQHEDGTISIEFEKSKPIYRRGKGKSKIVFPTNYVVVDLETTGFSATYDEIVEISCLRVTNGIVSDTFSSLVKPENGIDEYIAALTGITNEMVSNSPSIKSILPNVVSFIGSDIVVGHNVSFDINFLYDVCSSLLDIVFSNDYVDTMRISRKLYPKLRHHRLQDIVEHLNIKHGEFHRSLNDCDMAQKCFEAMKKEAYSKYPTSEDFISVFSRKVYSKLDVKSLSPNNTEFDTSHPLYGKLCVFTGVLEKMERKDAMQIVLDFGGQCGNTVTKKTNYLILGNNDYCSTIKDGKSGKQKKAEEYKLSGCDIEIIPENVFYDMIEDSTVFSGKAAPVQCDNFDSKIIDMANSIGYCGNELSLTNNEKVALVIMSEVFNENGLDFSRCRLWRRSEQYLSIVTDIETDFCRIKVGSHSTWFSLDLWHCEDKIKNDARLSCVKYRNVRHWKIQLSSIYELKDYSDIICASYTNAL